MSYKTLDREDVREAFLRLLDQKGTITSLDVKQDLRDQGFWAAQADVANHLYWICDEEQKPFTFNGTYRTYYNDPNMMPGSRSNPLMNDPDDEEDDDDSLGTLVSQNLQKPLRKSPLTPDEVKTGDWEVSWYGSAVEYFDGQMRRGKAKSLYHSIYGNPFIQLRAIRVQ